MLKDMSVRGNMKSKGFEFVDEEDVTAIRESQLF